MRRRRSAVVLAAAALMVAAACGERSRVDPGAIVVVEGTVTGPAGPVTDRPVRLGVGVTPADGAFAVLTVGLHCTTGACSGKVQDTETDDRGAFRFELQGRETQSTFGEAESVLVSVVGEPGDGEVSGALSSARFRVQTAEVELPPLELVDARLVVEDTGAVVARWQPVRPGPYEVSFETDDAELVWRTRTVEAVANLDPRVLEDAAGRAVVAGRWEEAVEGSEVELAWRSGGVPFVAAGGAPPSRGRPCRYLDSSGATAEHDECGLTDGELTTPAVSGAVCRDEARRVCEPAASAVVDLGGPVPAELVVVRGCHGGCAVDIGSDGAVYRPAGSVSEPFGAVALDGGPIRFVRVGLGQSATGLHEVSVWGPVPRPALRDVDRRDRARIAEPYADEGDRSGVPVALVVAAGVAIVAASAGGAFALGRRRSRALTQREDAGWNSP